MYSVKPYHVGTDDIRVPDCMYKMKKICSNSHLVNGASEVPREVEDLLNRQDGIIARLEALTLEVRSMASVPKVGSVSQSQRPTRTAGLAFTSAVEPSFPNDMVISCNPNYQPTALLKLLSVLARDHCVLLTEYVHNSANSGSRMDLKPYGFRKELKGVPRLRQTMVVTWIWKAGDECSMMVSPLKQTRVQGEINICRYLLCCAGDINSADVMSSTCSNFWLDVADTMLRGSKAMRLEAQSIVAQCLSKRPYLCGEVCGRLDLVVGSAFKQTATTGKWANDQSIRKWLANF